MRLKAVLDKLKQFNVKLNDKKCVFKVEQVNFLGHSLSEKGIEPNKELIASFFKSPYPSNKAELQSFIGSIQYYAKFIENLATKLYPLTNLLHKDVGFEFGEKEKTAVDDLKHILTSNLLNLSAEKKSINL